MRINRVLLQTFLNNYPNQDRATGRSLGIALSCIGSALNNPGQTTYVRDHHRSIEADKVLLQTVAQCIEKLGLKYISVDVGRNAIRYDLFVEVESL